MPELAIGIDLGGTKLKVGIVNRQGEILATEEHETPNSGLAILDKIEAICEPLISHWQPQAVGLGTPGLISFPEGKVLGCTPNLQDWEGRELKQLFSTKLSLPVLVDNDANAAAYGEWKAGGGKGLRDFILLTLGTGLGSGMIFESTLRRGFHTFGIGFGHIIVEHSGRWCNCGQQGCLETYVSGRGLYKTYRLLGGAAGVLGPEIFERAEQGEALACLAVEQTIDWLAAGVVSILNSLAPRRILLGGGLSRQGELRLLEPLRKRVRVIMSMPFDTPDLLQLALLGADAGMIGAALMALEETP